MDRKRRWKEHPWRAELTENDDSRYGIVITTPSAGVYHWEVFDIIFPTSPSHPYADSDPSLVQPEYSAWLAGGKKFTWHRKPVLAQGDSKDLLGAKVASRSAMRNLEMSA